MILIEDATIELRKSNQTIEDIVTSCVDGVLKDTNALQLISEVLSNN